MRVDIVARNGADHQWVAAEAIRTGFKQHGIDAHIVTQEAPLADVVVCWGGRQAHRVMTKGRRTLVIEAGYVGDRGWVSKGLLNWYSLAWDGLNGRGKVPAVGDGGERWRKHFDGMLKPWKTGGDAVVIMGQVPGDASIEGVDMRRWYASAIESSKRFGLPVYFRQHPVAIERGYTEVPAGVPRLGGSMADALAMAHHVVTYNSNSAVDAVLAGVPAIACDEGSMAWPVAGHGLDAEPPTPDRTEWAHRIAWRQWKKDEIEAGMAWDYLKGGLE